MANGDVFAAGNNYNVNPIIIHENVMEMDAGSGFVIFLQINGNILIDGVLGCTQEYVDYFKENNISIKSISAGSIHAAVLSTNG